MKRERDLTYLYIIIFLMLPVVVAEASDKPGNTDMMDLIISKHIEAHGGPERWDKVESIELTGQYTSFSLVHDFYTVKTADGLFFSDYHLGKHKVQEGYDGVDFWTIDPWQGFEFPRKINRAEKHVIMQKSDFFSPFYKWREKGYLVDYKGVEEHDGMEMHVFGVSRPDMPEETWYLDTKTFLAVKYNARWVDFAYAIPAETIFDDYREMNGLLVPAYIEQTFSTRHRITEIGHVTINPAIDNDLFYMPPCNHMQQISHLTGNWHVQVELMTRTGNWQTYDQVESVFALSTRDMINGSLSYEVNFPVSTQYTLTFNRRTNNYQLVVYNEFFSTTDLFDGQYEDGVLVFDDMPEMSSTDQKARPQDQQPNTRYRFEFQNHDAFYLLRSRSTNEAESWQDMERLSFQRADTNHK